MSGPAISRILLSTAVMALVTYLLRMLPVAIFKKKIENRFILSFLFYVPYAVLAAMTLPDILSSTASLFSALIGFAAAVLLAWRGKGLLTVALGASGAVFLAERLLSLL
ncbi:MAG: AzlD domain-containing protein [Provencibacterium sp.]|jgi:branched-subunit amino acid transport protein|nr:AzlD domain-containing protein [Provencibacterium sp.]